MKRDKHSLSFTKLLTCNQGELVPIGCFEALPGDTIQHSTSMLVRVSPLVTPVMHPVHVYVHHWFVPNRLIWTGDGSSWEDFITGGDSGTNASTHPTITVNSGSGFAVGSLADYLGVPTGVDDLPVSALPFRAYAKIFNEWYRDEDLVTELTIDTTDGADTTTNTTLQMVAWQKDFFTVLRTTPQKGANVSLPLGTSATVRTSASRLVTGAQQRMTIWNDFDGASGSANRVMSTGDDGASLASMDALASGSSNTELYPGNLYADLTNATAATITDLRRALAIQRFEEMRSQYGSRYVEYLRAAFGVKSSDARMQRPEYLGGGKQTIQFSEVLQTSVNASGTPLTGVGNLAGHGIAAMRSNRYRRFIEEHGLIITLLNVKPLSIYASGLPKMWSRTTKFDYFQKELQHIGQQEVYNKEVRWAHTTPNGIFGYGDRYDEYKHGFSSVSGDFRTTLNTWHMARFFASDPALNSSFITADPTNRIYQSTSTDQLLIMAHHSIQARRLVSKSNRSYIS